MNATLVLFPFSLLFLHPATDLNMQLPDVIAGLEHRETAFFNSESMLLKYEWRDTDHLTLSPEEEVAFIELRKKGDFGGVRQRFPRQSIMRTPGYRHEFAIKGSSLFMRITNPLDRKYGELGLTASYDGNFGAELDENHHAEVEAEPSPYTWQDFDYGFVQLLDVYSRVKGLDKYRVIPPAKRMLCLLEELKEQPRRYSLKGSEVIGGEDTLLIERQDTHRIWIAPELGFAIRRVDLFLEGSGFSEDFKVSSHLMSDFRKAKDDLWLPWTITEELFDASSKRRGPADANPAGAAVSPKMQVRRTLAVESVEFDTLKPEFFQLPLPAGIHVRDRVRNIEYVNQKDGIPFTDAIEFARANTAAQPFPLQTILLLLANIGIVLVLVFYFLRRRRLR